MPPKRVEVALDVAIMRSIVQAFIRTDIVYHMSALNATLAVNSRLSYLLWMDVKPVRTHLGEGE